LIEVIGIEKTNAELNKYVKSVKSDISDIIKATALSVEADAIKSIQRGTKTGKTYKRGDTSHQASAPGEAPATDTGSFVNSIRAVIDESVAFVGTNDERGMWFEWGTTKIKPRPWLQPAWNKNKRTFVRLIRGVL